MKEKIIKLFNKQYPNFIIFKIFEKDGKYMLTYMTKNYKFPYDNSLGYEENKGFYRIPFTVSLEKGWKEILE